MTSPKSSSPSRGSSRKRKKLALGKGLDALIPGIRAFDDGTVKDQPKEMFKCKTELIQPNRFQPRIHFSKRDLQELSDSIKSQGVLQPLIVRNAQSGYELVAGERRLRAAKLAGLNEVPIILKDVSDSEMLEISIVENIQRENLNPMEEAEAYYRLIDEFGITQEQAAERVGKSRSAVANFLRLRQLPDPIKASIMSGDISMGHARALLGLDTSASQHAAWRLVVSKKLSVRQTESLVKRLKKEKKQAKPEAPNTLELQLIRLSENLSRHFGTKVQIKRRGKIGKIELEFYGNEDLDRLLNLLNPSAF